MKGEAFFEDLTLRMEICDARNFIAPLMALIRAGGREDRATEVMLEP